MQIWTSYYAKMKKLYFDYVVVGVSTSVPRWFPYEVECLPEVYPGWDLVLGIKYGRITQEEYGKMYWAKLMEIDRVSVTRKLEQMYEKYGKDIVLTCYEKPGDFCHRHILGKWLEMNIRELL